VRRADVPVGPSDAHHTTPPPNNLHRLPNLNEPLRNGKSFGGRSRTICPKLTCDDSEAACLARATHTNPTRKRGISNPFRIIEDPSLARRVSVEAGSVRRSIHQRSTTNCRCAAQEGLTGLALETAMQSADPASVRRSATGRETGLDRGGSMHEYDKSSKWLIQHHGDSILRLAGVRDIASWQPLPAELVQSRRLPAGH